MRFDHRKCEDDQDARRMAESILRERGFNTVESRDNRLSVDDRLSTSSLQSIARHADRIARWARKEVAGRGPSA